MGLILFSGQIAGSMVKALRTWRLASWPLFLLGDAKKELYRRLSSTVLGTQIFRVV
jgi:hypothetical protein